MTSRYTVVDVAQEICMRARQAKSARACKCGKPAIEHRREPVCRGCDEDSFYGRDIPGSKTAGME